MLRTFNTLSYDNNLNRVFNFISLEEITKIITATTNERCENITKNHPGSCFRPSENIGLAKRRITMTCRGGTIFPTFFIKR